MDWLGKAIEFAERRAWIATAVLAFVLFVPEEPAKQLGIAAIRNQWRGYLWIALFATALLMLVGAFRYVDKRIVGWFAKRLEDQKAKKAKEEAQARLTRRLDSLNADEYGLVMLCLHRRSQSFSAKLGHVAASSLCDKRLVSRGSGTVFNVAYHFSDDAWQYIVEHRQEFLSDEDAAKPEVQEAIKAVEYHLHDHF